MRLPSDHLITQRMKAPLMRSLNGIELLNLIAEHGPVSRAELAKLSRLSKPTVSSQVETLVQQALVIELGQGESGARGGKKPTMIRFNADAGRIFAVEINADEIRVAVGDLEGKVLTRTASPVGSDRRAPAVLSLVSNQLAKVIPCEASSEGQNVIAVASPGRVDVRRGITLAAGNVFNWSDVPIRAPLEASFGVPVFVDNNVKMATLGELHFGAAKGAADVAVVRMDFGVGCGIVLRGRLVHGRHWAAGEIAHMNLDLRRINEDWSVRGYLESMTAPDRVLEAAPVAADSPVAFLRRARTLSGKARAVFDRVAAHLGAAVANLVLVYDPALVVLQGEILAELGDEIREIVARAVPWPMKLVTSEIAGDAVLLGALAAGRATAYERIAQLFDGRDTAQARHSAVAARRA